jgi:hypothetical protein
VSPITGTETVLEPTALVKETVPEELVKSPGALAVPPAVDQLTCSGQHPFGRGATWIVNVAFVVPTFPSATVTSVIVTVGTGAAAAGVGMTIIRSPAAVAQPTARPERRPRILRTLAGNPKSLM